jgi:hypothetical protein
MSLIWPASEADVVLDQPRLHALVVAVGDYPHLIGGAGPLAADPFGLSQVTTPRFTGPLVAEWLLTSLNNNARPLGSLEVLLSPGAPIATPAGPVMADRATMGNIQKAFDAWFKRCNARPDNASLLYFCGHGMAKVSQYLLAEDFGHPDDADIWKKCIDFDGLKVHMRKCRAQTQLFFVDACRETPFGLLAQIDARGERLVSATFNDPPVPCSAAYRATTDGRQAYGPDDGPTYFSQALICCLNGVAAQLKNGKWIVDTFSLANALGQTIGHSARRLKLPLSCNPDPGGLAVIHEAPAPRVAVAIECTSVAANDVADIRLDNGAQVVHSPPGNPKPIFEEVAAGIWTVAVSFPGGQFPSPPPEQQVLMPPVFEGVPVP